LRAGGADATSSSSSIESTTTSSSTPTISDFPWSDRLELGPPDAILGIAQRFRECTDPRKINLVIGAYRDATGSPWILPTVAAAEAAILQQQADHPEAVNKEYLPIEGDADFIAKAVQFAYGSDLVAQRPIAAVQSLSGTGACRIGGAFLKLALPSATQIYIPVPTWGNHWQIVRHCGFADPQPYRYYDPRTNRLDFDGLLEDLEQAPDGSIVLLHACAHNPTGCDPTAEQWKEIAQLLRRKRHVAFLDSAYQGFASGDAARDAGALRYLVAQGDIPILLAQSFGAYCMYCSVVVVVVVVY